MTGEQQQQQQQQEYRLTSTTAPGVVFKNRAELAAHYQTDWHRYNLKRREAGLPVLLYGDFWARFQAAQALRQEQEQKKSGGGGNGRDHIKNHQDDSKNKKKNKKKSKGQQNDSAAATVVSQVPFYERIKEEQEHQHQHQQQPVEEALAQKLTLNQAGEEEKEDATAVVTTTSPPTSSPAQDTMENQEDNEDEDEMHIEIDPCQSLFDRHHVSESVSANLDYMARKYGFFVPDREYCVDLAGLLGYCHEKIQVGHVCLYCQRVFATASACQKHMIAVTHCKLQYETGVDLEDLNLFYDFEPANTAFRQGLGGSKKKKEKSEGYDEDGDAIDDQDDDDDWEDMSEEGEEGDEMKEDDDDDDDNLYESYQDEVARMGFDVTPLGELIFPDGRIIGHRAFSRYYKQRTPNNHSNLAVQAARQAAGERLYRGHVYNLGGLAASRNSNSSNQRELSTQNSFALAQAGLNPSMVPTVSSRVGKGLLVPAASQSWTQVSVYRYRAALRKERRGQHKGRQLFEKQALNINKMDKKHNRLMNDVCVQKAPR